MSRRTLRHCSQGASRDAGRAHYIKPPGTCISSQQVPGIGWLACCLWQLVSGMELTGHRYTMKLLSIHCAFLTSALQAVAAQKPNIPFLLSDDHSYPFLSCYGDANVKTPVLDGLAADGIKFHRFFTSAPQCVPSRAALMTGRLPVAARITRFCKQEFSANRKPAGADEWFAKRDANHDGSISRDEYLPESPASR